MKKVQVRKKEAVRKAKEDVNCKQRKAGRARKAKVGRANGQKCLEERGVARRT